jgi:hypothetical protein
VRPISRLRPDSDISVVAKRGEQVHQTFAGEVCESSIEKRPTLILLEISPSIVTGGVHLLTSLRQIVARLTPCSLAKAKRWAGSR